MSTAIDVSAIERELNSLWKQVGSEEDSGIIRACLLNFLVYTPNAAGAGKLDEMITDITAEHPGRAILMIADRSAAESGLGAEVTSRCIIPTGTSRQVCCEQVTVTATGAQVNEMASAVVPLLISDLPVYLWWRAAPQLDDRVFERLGEVSDRVIIDTATFADPKADMIRLAAIIGDNPRWTAFTDLNWSRLTAWRALLAGFYDVPEYRPLMNEINRVAIEYAPLAAGSIPARAIILAGWLASRLRWSLEGVSRENGSTIFDMKSDGRSLRLSLVATANPDIEAGHLASVSIGSAMDEAASFAVSRSADGKRIETSVSLGEKRHAQRVLGYESWSESALIGRELEILGHDRVFEQAVVSAGEMIAAIG
jgi:glucose-6-phosphate dehydrogenase assembly protein OpcA